uniref:Uncharacterized protein n=1 Tax=Chenopodium quinoa TaxID=63459 RepID=A0A803LSP6_CHEQI
MTKNGSKKPEIASKSILAAYEKVRSMTIERNAQKFRELGLDKIAQQLLEKNKNFAKGKENVNSNVDDQDYVPDEENCDQDEEFEMSREATTSIPKKKARTREQPPRKNKKQPLCPSMAMDDFLVAQNQMDPAEVRQIELPTYTNWKQVPNKEKIREFVNSKYILPVEAKDWVMETLDQSWRGFKCRLKRDHYYMYDTYEERLKHPPERVPEAHYKTLLAY